MDTLAKPAIEAVENGDIEFVPKHFENTYFAWMRNIQDWCISRQQWWGHKIPAWYDAEGNIYVGRNESEVRQKHNLEDSFPLTQDDDVLETWFSSALWTFGTLGWPEETEELELYHPTDVLITGHDIIFFWVARMIMMTLHFTGEIPFRKVYIHGLVRDGQGQKMSKTKGNGLDPLDFVDGISLEALVEKRTTNLTQPQMAARIEKDTRKDFPNGIEAYGTDALRFTFCALATLGRDVSFDVKRIEGYRNFANKLWNATRFVLQNTESYDASAPRTQSLADRWIISRLHQMLAANRLALETYRFDLLANSLYEFIWHEFCDWYVEIAKPLLWSDATSEAELAGTRNTLLEVLEASLRALHPVMPFITDTLWREVAGVLGKPGSTVMVEHYPEPQDFAEDQQADAAIEWLKGVVQGVRSIRGRSQHQAERRRAGAAAGRRRGRSFAFRSQRGTAEAVGQSRAGHLAHPGGHTARQRAGAGRQAEGDGAARRADRRCRRARAVAEGIRQGRQRAEKNERKAEQRKLRGQSTCRRGAERARQKKTSSARR